MLAIFRFVFIWLVLFGGIAALVFMWRAITRKQVWNTSKLLVSGIVAFLVALGLSIMEQMQ